MTTTIDRKNSHLLMVDNAQRKNFLSTQVHAQVGLKESTAYIPAARSLMEKLHPKREIAALLIQV